MILKFKNLKEILFIVFSLFFMSSCTPTAGGGLAGGAWTGKIICNCDSNTSYVTGTGSNFEQAKSNAQSKCNVVGSQVSNCKPSN